MSDFAFAGLNLAITTPFDAQGRIDFQRFGQLIERYIEAGVDGFVLSSGTGMHVYLSGDESSELIAYGARVIAGRARVIAQTSALLVEEVVERTRRAADAGADGVMVLPPFLRQLCEIPNFIGVKDSSGDLAAQASLMRTGLPVMNGADPLAPYALFAGCAGLIWGGANMAPKTCVALVRAAREKRWDDAREIWRQLEPVMSLIWQGDYVQSVYAGAQITGYDAGQPRRPLARLPAQKTEALREALSALHDPL